MLHMQTLRFNGIREDENGRWLDVTPTSAWQPVHAPPGPVCGPETSQISTRGQINEGVAILFAALKDLLCTLQDVKLLCRCCKVQPSSS